jgi:DsbC/DsbD-like thiol-disulfide interchange protein
MPASSLPLIVALAIGAADGPTITKHLSVAVAALPTAAVPGGRVSLVLDVTPEQKDYIPISLALETNAAVRAHPIQFPKPETLVLKDLGETQLVYTKPFRIVQDVTVAKRPALAKRAGTGGGSLTIKGRLTYQACDNAICYAPVTVPVVWTLDVKRPGKVTP